jgi:hypothetical protein
MQQTIILSAKSPNQPPKPSQNPIPLSPKQRTAPTYLYYSSCPIPHYPPHPPPTVSFFLSPHHPLQHHSQLPPPSPRLSNAAPPAFVEVELLSSSGWVRRDSRLAFVLGVSRGAWRSGIVSPCWRNRSCWFIKDLGVLGEAKCVCVGWWGGFGRSNVDLEVDFVIK